MLKGNILSRKTKLISIVVLMVFITYICISTFLQIKESYAAQSTEGYSSKINNYPGYKELIDNLKAKYPNWQFKILYTGLDWNQVIKNETSAAHGRNLVYYDKTGAWICSTCGNKAYDTGKWRCASEVAVSYYMDPRNWLNEDYIFQFENLKYDSSTQTIDGVNKIINNAPWMRGSQITYTKTDGSTATINKSYAQVIMEAAQASNISPYHLASRIVQEQGSNSTASSTGKGTYSGYVGYYNFYNINATGRGNAAVISNALSYARRKGWTDPETAIKGGAAWIASGYINVGQSTLYLQKYDVDNSDGKLYYHQYMGNISAAVSESTSVKKSYSSLGMLNNSFTFVIPVFENMPTEKCGSPNGSSIITQNVKVTGTDVKVRTAPSLLGTVLTKVNTGDVLLRIECGATQVSGYYWDKVVLSSGVKGYIARNYITQIADVTNANISAVSNTSVNLRNGPGTSDTKIVTTLISGQAVTIIEKGTYNNINGFNWVRVKLANGTQGYIADKYLTEIGNNPTPNPSYKIATIKCDSGKVRIRAQATTSSGVVTSLSKGTTVTIMQENVAQANGYTWDKIVTSDGLEGYVANQYLNKDGGSDNNKGDDNKNDNDKGNDNNNNDNNNNVKTGDCNGDGVINSGDLLALKKYLLKTLNITDQSIIKAMDVNKDGAINSGDLLLIKKHLLGTYTISN